MSRSDAATVRFIHDRLIRNQKAYALRLREQLESIRPLVDERFPEAVEVAEAIESELAHIAFGSAIVEQ